jgi:hypothetical protein
VENSLLKVFLGITPTFDRSLVHPSAPLSLIVGPAASLPSQSVSEQGLLSLTFIEAFLGPD